jgi:DNA-binding transcriptional MerR regulator
MRIGEVARLTDVKVPTIRYYEQIGLLPPPPRPAGERRLYEAPDVQRLALIRHARALFRDRSGAQIAAYSRSAGTAMR